jgi:hypothetical protein
MPKHLDVEHSVELTFHFAASYTPGKPAKMPDFKDDVGHPEEPDEWDIEKMIDVTFRHRKFDQTLGHFEVNDVSLMKYIKDETVRKLVLHELANAIQASELNEEFAEAVSEKASD